MRGEHLRQLLDLPAGAGATRIVGGCLDRAEDAVFRLQGARDPTALHDLRVSLRRARTTLKAYEIFLGPAASRKLRRGFRDLATSTSSVRDAEVQLAWLEERAGRATDEEEAGVAALRRDLMRSVEDGYAKLAREIPLWFRKIDRRQRKRLAGLEEALAAAGAAHGARFRSAVWRAVTERSEECRARLSGVKSVEDTEGTHRARIGAKRLRYVIEPVADETEGGLELVGRLQRVQDLLGDLHDSQLLADRLAERSASLPEERAAERPGLHRVREWLAEDADRCFAELRAEWLDGAEEFFSGVRRLAEGLGAAAEENIEIERKYLLTDLPPEVANHGCRQIDQGYLPGKLLQERVRRIRSEGGERYVRAVKLGAGIRRIELQEESSPELFEALWPLTEGHRVTKVRYSVPDGDLTWEVDRFTDRDLVLAEVELKSESERPPLPGWLAPHVAREVTGEPEYLNVNLAR